MRESKANTRVEIPQFPSGKRIALTTSFDDGVVHDRKVVEAFNNWGIRGTFNLNSGKLSRTGRPAPEGAWHIDASEVSSLYKGHEVAVHTVTHPHLTKLDQSQIAMEVINDRRALEDLVEYPVRGMAYPFGSYDNKVISVLRQCGIAYSRTCENTHHCFPPEEPLAWASTAHMFRQNPAVADTFENLYGNSRYSGVIYIWGHSYEFDQGGHTWADLDRIFKPMSGRSDVWYCTNIELFDYEAARSRMVISANLKTAYNPSAIPVSVSVDGRLMDIAPGRTAGI